MWGKIGCIWFAVGSDAFVLRILEWMGHMVFVQATRPFDGHYVVGFWRTGPFCMGFFLLFLLFILDTRWLLATFSTCTYTLHHTTYTCEGTC